MSRIPLDHPHSLFVRLMRAYSRRRYGAVLEPGLAQAHNRRVLLTMIGNESRIARWKSLDPTLKALATLAAAARIGCRWCLDFGYLESRNAGVSAAKLRAVPAWRDADVYDDDERAVLAYAEAMTATPPTVSDAMVEDLRTRLSDRQLVELTAMIAVENQRSRVNAAFGLTSQGFADHCDLRDHAAATDGVDRSSRPTVASSAS